MNVSDPAEVLSKLGLELPAPVDPIGSYVSAVTSAQRLFVGAHGPLRSNGKPLYQGRIGRDFDMTQAAQIALGATLNVLASAYRSLGSLSAIEKVIQFRMFAVSDDDFLDLEAVCNPSLEMLGKVFRGAPAATFACVTSLPNNVPVFVELLVSIRDGGTDTRGDLQGTRTSNSL